MDMVDHKKERGNPQALNILRFDQQGFLPAVAQDWRDGTVLMVGYMNREALKHTFRTGYVHFWSRSRNELWKKGETSGNYLLYKKLFVDCDYDTLLVKAEPVGPICHTGRRSCFFVELTQQGVLDKNRTEEADGGILDRLYEMILQRKQVPSKKSYVSSLLQAGSDQVLKKVSEEAGEVMLAVKNDSQEEIVYEVADLLFHTIIALGYSEVPIKSVYAELGKRFGKSGLKKKTKKDLK